MGAARGAPVDRRFTSLVEPLVEKNTFRRRDREPCRIPEFDEVQPRLPIPIFPDNPDWEQLYWRAWKTLWRSFRAPASGSPLVAGFPQPGENGNVQMGHEAFIATLSGYIPGSFSLIDFLDNFYANQHEDGFICREFNPETGVDYHEPFEPNSTGPNLLAWAEWRHFRLTGDKERIAAVFWPLLAYHRWCRANRTWRSGLYWTTGYAGGLINQPRVPGGRYHHKHWAWIDASAQAVIDCEMLERMAVLLGEQELADEVAAERDALSRTINAEMWNEEAKFYQDVASGNHFSDIKSIAAYWALLDSQLVPKERQTPFIQHLRDTWSFRTETVVPSLAADSQAYNSKTGNGWRGAVWPSLTYMVLRGLSMAAQWSLTHKLATLHLETVCRVYQDTGCFWENYAPEEAAPGDPAIEDMTGLTPAAIVAMTLEHILGLSVDWPLRQVTWRRYLEGGGDYGVRNLPLGNEGTLDLVSAGESIRIRCDTPFTLTVINEQEVVQMAVPVGTFEFELA